MPNRVGQQLGNYRLLRLLGRGGFAEVYLGEHVYLKRRAAIKVLHTSLEDEDIDPFLAEAQLLARLNHPHIVRVHDFAVEQGTPFLAIDYALHGTLRHRHPRGSCLSLATTVAYVKQVAAALQYAHTLKVIHRDVKPENMLVGASQEVLLSDFGISLFTPSPEQLSTQNMTGTLSYMAPEQIRGKPGFASDQYSLSIVVYEWLCGVRPFEGSVTEVMVQHLTMPPPALREKDPSLPEAVEAVVLQALAKEPADRYGSVQLFAQALEQASAVSLQELRSESEGTAPFGPLSSLASLIPPLTPRRVFVSASQADHPFVERLKTDLEKRGILAWDENPYRTQHELEQEDPVRQAMRAVDVVVVVLSPSARSSRTIKEHLRIARLYQRRMVFVWVAGEEITDVLPEELGRTSQIDLVDAHEGRYERALDELMAYLGQEHTPAAELSLLELAFEPRNPYKGLRAFTQNDAADFFGRDRLIEELVDKAKSMLTSGQPGTPPARLLAVIGPSGSGKSSVVMAGLLPQLQRGALPGSQQWVYLEPMVPGVHSLEALALTLAPHLPERSLKTLREDLEEESARGLHLLTTQIVKAPAQKVVLLIDQFEELFTLTTSEEERQHFIDLLVTAVTEPHSSVIVLLTLRADFYDRPLSYPSLSRLIVRQQVVVGPMDVNDLRAVIKRPAMLPDVQLSFEGSLVGDLLFEVRGQAGALPLLQFTLEQLFKRRSGNTFTLKAYHEIGGVKGALTKHAESTYGALPSEEHRKLARALFLRLIDPGLTEQDTTRRRAALTELVLPTPKETELLQRVSTSFLTSRLLTTNEIAGTPTIEVSHEALIREWPRLADWLREAREDIHLQQTLSEDVAAWQRRGKPKDRLYRGSQLKEARMWVERNKPSRNEIAFLNASVAQRLRFVISVIAVLLLLVSSIGITGWFLFQSKPNPTVVTTLNDNDLPGSLRWDIANAPPGSTITFDKSLWGQTILLTSDLQIASKSLSIHGPGAGMLTIKNSIYQVHVFFDASLRIFDLTLKGSKFNYTTLLKNEGTLSLTNSVVSGNSVSGQGNQGGGIQNAGTLTLINSVVSGNSASGYNSEGGGIENAGTLTLINSVVSGNSVSGKDKTSEGGGIFNNVGGTLTLTNSVVSGNSVSGQQSDSGGIANAGVLTITNSSITGNMASGEGGGIVTYTDSTLTITNSTISGNTVSEQDSDGGGIANGPNSRVTLTNSTISGNTSSSKGGGIANFGSQVDIEFCTIYGNKTSGNGGGISIEDGQDYNGKTVHSRVSIRNSIIAGNRTGTGPNISGPLTSDGYNLVQGISGANFAPNQQHSTDVSVDSHTDLKIDSLLRNNGGPTKTLVLLPGSPAIDKIPLDACHVKGITTDQRGVKRPDGNESACDIGAYESSP